MNVIDIGLGNFVSADRIVAVVSPESAPVKRLIQDAKDKGKAIDATLGRRTRAVLVMDSGQIALSSIQPTTIITRNDSKVDSKNKKVKSKEDL